LIVESTVTVTLTADGCEVLAGRWVDVYTGAVFTDPSALDIDHMVPLAEANRSGGAAWQRAAKTIFANDLAYPGALLAVSASSNRSKGDRTPDEWRPPAHTSWCLYATSWVDVKYEWHLTVTAAERDALADMLATC
jgi:hypothetical protein